MKILYVVSTLASSGPTNQLFSLVKFLDKKNFKVTVVTLSPEPAGSRWVDFEQLDVPLISLNLSRIAGIFSAKKNLKKVIRKIQPDLIHTQGIRADGLLASMKLDIPWVMTSRNFPTDDYPTKFGAIKGALMVRQHLSAMKQCSHLVTCSKTIQTKLKQVGVEGTAIQNGVRQLRGDASAVDLYADLPRPIYISVGSLIPRKNMALLIDAFEKLPSNSKGSLVILGDGPLLDGLRKVASKNVHLVGNVANVPDYLAGADYFVSSSLSEGLPNTVLEALAMGLPCILSDIESHQEIVDECPNACSTFSLDGGVPALTEALGGAPSDFDDKSREEAVRVAQDVFSAEGMSQRYQQFYLNILEAQ